MAMTPAQKRAAVLTAAKDLAAHPDCYNGCRWIHAHHPEASTDPRCLLSHLVGRLAVPGAAEAVAIAAGFTEREACELFDFDASCASAAEMYERAVKLCDRLWPEDWAQVAMEEIRRQDSAAAAASLMAGLAAEPDDVWRPIPGATCVGEIDRENGRITFVDAPEPDDVRLVNITAADPPQGTTAFERLELIVEASPHDDSQMTNDLRLAVEYLRCWSTAPHRADSPGHALFEVRS